MHVAIDIYLFKTLIQLQFLFEMGFDFNIFFHEYSQFFGDSP